MENQDEIKEIEYDFDPVNPYGLTQSERFSEVSSVALVVIVLLGSFLKVMFF